LNTIKKLAQAVDDGWALGYSGLDEPQINNLMALGDHAGDIAALVDANDLLRKELKTLRVSLARVVQRLVVGSAYVPLALDVEGLNYAKLWQLALTRERGWNALAGDCVEKADEICSELDRLRAG
jgi:hypothetical protein